MPIFPRLLPHFPPSPTSLPTPSHTSSQAGEDSALPQAGATPPGEDASLSQVSTPPTPLPSQPTALLPSPEDRGAPNLPNTQAGQSSNPTYYPRQGSRHPPRQSPPQASQEVQTTSREGNNSTNPPARHPQGSSKEEPNPKWVINLSNKPLTPAQRSVLAKGPNFVVTPRQASQLRVHNCHRSSLY